MTKMDDINLNHTVQFWNYLDHEQLKSFLFVNFTTQSVIYLKDINSDYVIFENNTFDSNIGIHGGCIHMDN